MKKQLLILFSIFSIALISSCKEDEPAPHIVGEWSLREFAVTEIPSTYYYYNDPITYTKEEFGYNSYKMTINNDGSYTRTIIINTNSGTETTDDSGSWEITDDTFVLSSDNIGLSDDWAIQKNENNKLWLVNSIVWPLIKVDVFEANDDINAYLDELYLDGLTNEEYAATFDDVTIDLITVFEK